MSDKLRYSDSELQEFKKLILKKLENAEKDYLQFRNVLTNSDNNDISDTSPTFKVLEEGANVFSREEAGRFAQRQEEFIYHLKGALARIENKTYGICRASGKLISKERLKIVSHATLSIDSKRKRDKRK
ncbi:MAG: molecular chaperone DnaK [Bacteroidetes bacterium 4572_128]|nr:MAG: molecular chaperone DnaK [Bacteroidetes bacterium 4572_128]